uniref:Uncharacterized protein n=1 Tax=Knipowitschia caucasica TaxID=637954 RepID=A0AAV2K9J4_KNICA
MLRPQLQDFALCSFKPSSCFALTLCFKNTSRCNRLWCCGIQVHRRTAQANRTQAHRTQAHTAPAHTAQAHTAQAHTAQAHTAQAHTTQPHN